MNQKCPWTSNFHESVCLVPAESLRSPLSRAWHPPKLENPPPQGNDHQSALLEAGLSAPRLYWSLLRAALGSSWHRCWLSQSDWAQRESKVKPTMPPVNQAQKIHFILLTVFCWLTTSNVGGDSVCAKSLQSCLTLCDPPETAACQASLSMGFSRQEYWTRLPCPPPGDLPNPGVAPPIPALAGDSPPQAPPGKSTQCLA